MEFLSELPIVSFYIVGPIRVRGEVKGLESLVHCHERGFLLYFIFPGFKNVF